MNMDESKLEQSFAFADACLQIVDLMPREDHVTLSERLCWDPLLLLEWLMLMIEVKDIIQNIMNCLSRRKRSSVIAENAHPLWLVVV
jgi:hypothetical protein